MDIKSLMELVKYSKNPTAVHIDNIVYFTDKNGNEQRKVKKYRYKFDDFASFLEKAQKSEFLKKTTIDEVVVQRSLLNDEKEFIMVYCTRDEKDKKDEG